MADRRKLAVLRAEHGLTRMEMASKIGVSRSTYSAIENGRRDCSPKFIGRLQAAFNIPDEDVWGLLKIHNESEE